MDGICHAITQENWYISQTGPRTVGVYDRSTDALIETVSPPVDWKDWLFHVDDNGIVFTNPEIKDGH